MNSNNVFNYDETRVNIPEISSKRVFSSGRISNNNHGLRQRPLATLLSFVGADGKLFISVYILKTAEIDGIEEGKLSVYFPHQRCSTRSSITRYFGYTKTGYINSSIFRLVMDEFSNLWQLRYPRMHCYVFGDQFGAHLDPKTIE